MTRARRHRRAAAARAVRQDARGEELPERPADRCASSSSRCSTCACTTTSTRRAARSALAAARRGARAGRGAACRRPTTASRTASRTSSPAATRRATTATSGPRCCRPTPTACSRRTACSTRETGARFRDEILARRRQPAGARVVRRLPRPRAEHRRAAAAQRHDRVPEARDLERQLARRCGCRTCSTGSPRAQPDVVCLQETKTRGRATSRSPRSRPRATRRVYCGQKTYNGVAILARSRARRRAARHPGFRRRPEARDRRDRRRRAGGLRCTRRTARASGSDKYAYKLRWYAALARMAARTSSQRTRGSRCSATSTSRPRTATCTTRSAGRARSMSQRARARGVPRAARRSGLQDAFRLFEQPEKQFTLVGLPAERVPAQAGACASTTSCSRRRSRATARPARSTRSRASASGRPTTRR